MNILIVDDDATLRFVLQATLKSLGHLVVAAQDGAEGLRIFEQCHPPLVISDLLMPGIDGMELCRRIRKANHSQYTYIILLTAVEGKSGYLAGMEAGADDFITKPFDKEMLAARVVVAKRILSLQSQVKQLAGLLPICCICKKVRDDKNYWHQVESFVARHSEATFTHSYCPDCLNKLMTEVETMEGAEVAEKK
jgi:DNA-binding response OmpR family regulator